MCTQCTYTLYKTWTHGVTPNHHPRHQPVKDFTYLPMLGSFNNLNIVQFSYKATYSEKVGKIIRLYLMASATTWLNWRKLVNMVPLRQKI